MNKNTLQIESDYYKSIKSELIKYHLGQVVLIKSNIIYGYFHSEQEAYKKGLEYFGNVPMLIKKIKEIEEPVYILNTNYILNE